MKKLLLFLPVGLIASAGLAWFGVDYYYSAAPQSQNAPTKAQSGQELFSQSEESLRRLIRHGEGSSIPALKHSLDALSLQLPKYRAQNFSTAKIETALAAYEKDSVILSEKIMPHLKSLHESDALADSQEKNFERSIEQIGLHELQSAAATLERLQRNFIKNPSEEEQLKYEAESDKIRAIISELYLDESIEKPLMAYVDNHRRYFESIRTAYNDIGFERINRLRSNGYAIRTELQLLPSL